MSVKKVHDENVGYKVTNLGFQANQKIKNVTKPLEDEAIYDRPFESIAIVPAGQLDLMVGAVQPICIEATPAGANTPTIMWTSEDPEYVQVRAEQKGMEVENGVVTKISDGVLTAAKKTTSPVTVKATAVKEDGSYATSSITVRVLDGTEPKATLTVVGGENVSVLPASPVEVIAGDSVQISATASTGYHFVKWNDENTDNPRTVTVSANVTYTAMVEQDAPVMMTTSAKKSSKTTTTTPAAAPEEQPAEPEA